jgi:hypothetical protein
MGTDIHLYVEHRTPEGWASCDAWGPDKYTEGMVSVPYGEQFYTGRSYDLFAILADVRNGRGFGGIVTGSGFVPIAAPRGLPFDMSPELEAYAEAACDHTPSWLTLAELLAFDWTQTSTKEGCVDPQNWARWRDQGRPEEWSGDVSGAMVQHHTPEAFEAAWQKLREERGYPEQRHASTHLNQWNREKDLEAFTNILGEGKSHHTRVTWKVSYADAAKDFWWSVIPRLLRLGVPGDVRIVFWFDS